MINNLYLFWNYKYFTENRLIFVEKGINLIFIDTYKNNKTYSVKKIINEFQNKHIEWNTFILSLWKVSVNWNLINISKAIESIIKINWIPIKNFIWSNYKNSLVFNNKIPTLEIIWKYWLTPIKNKVIKSELDLKDCTFFPSVLKIDWLTWWCWMRYINSDDKLINTYKEFNLGISNNIFLSEFIEWIEISFSIFRIGDNFIRLPISFREKSDNNLTHPDDKLKITWFLWWFEEVYKNIENLMIWEDIYWAFYIEWIYDKESWNIKFLEWWTRLSWSTPIRFKSMLNYNIFEQIWNYIIWEKILYPTNYSLSVQYWYNIINTENINFDSLKNLSFLYKIENKSDLLFSNSNSLRLRININSDNLYWLFELIYNLWLIIWEKWLENRIKILVKDLIDTFWYKNILSPICNVIKNVNSSKFYIWEFNWDGKNITAVMWIIIDKNLNILLVNNPKRWIWLPWWHIESNESTETCIIREIKEETWINIDTLSYFWFNEITSDNNNIYPNKSYIFYYFKLLDYEIKYNNEKLLLLNINDFLNLKTNSNQIVNFTLYFLDLFKKWKNQ